MSYILPSELEQLLSTPSKRSTFLIIDVRSSDFVGGNIPGALNLTTDKFSSPMKLERTIAQHIVPKVSEGLSLIIVHCMRSQTRGPYVSHSLNSSPSLPQGVQVKILKGGYQAWYRTYKGRKELFENLDEEEQEEWEDVVNANEGDKEEAEDSKELRERLAKE
ncbi:hypothetical protein JCM16303_006502 [Sporobolomyces ruberrimus]